MTKAFLGREPHSVALVSGTLFAAAGFVSANRPTSWIGPGLSGHLAVPCYVLKSGRSALIIDTGLTAHWDANRSGLHHALADAAHSS